MPNVAASGCTSHQRNTHSNESRVVRYPWHPWFDQEVWIHRTRAGETLPVPLFQSPRQVPSWESLPPEMQQRVARLKNRGRSTIFLLSAQGSGAAPRR